MGQPVHLCVLRASQSLAALWWARKLEQQWATPSMDSPWHLVLLLLTASLWWQLAQ